MARRDNSRQQNRSKSDQNSVKSRNSGADRSKNPKGVYNGQSSGKGSSGRSEARSSGKGIGERYGADGNRSRSGGRSTSGTGKRVSDRVAGKDFQQHQRNSAVKETTEVRTYGTSAESWSLPVSVSVETESQLRAVLSVGAVKCIYVDEACFGFGGDMGSADSEKAKDKKDAEAEAFAEIIREIHGAGKQAGLRLRRVERDTDPCLNSLELVQRLIDKDAAPDGILIRSYDEAMMLYDLETSESGNKALKHIKKIFDYTCYGYNTEAVSMLLDLGAEKLTYPIELTYRECINLRRSLKEHDCDRMAQMPYDVLVYGHLPMMVSANCIQRTSDRCDHKNRILRLRDRMQKDMPVRCYCKYCYNQIFNAEPLVLYDCPEEIQSLEPEYVRYDFTVESGKAVLSVLSGAIPKNITRGHFRHGIE